MPHHGSNATTDDLATLTLASAGDILDKAMRGSVLMTAVNGHLTDAECRDFLDSAPEDWPGKPLHSAGHGYCTSKMIESQQD